MYRFSGLSANTRRIKPMNETHVPITHNVKRSNFFAAQPLKPLKSLVLFSARFVWLLFFNRLFPAHQVHKPYKKDLHLGFIPPLFFVNKNKVQNIKWQLTQCKVVNLAPWLVFNVTLAPITILYTGKQWSIPWKLFERGRERKKKLN